MFLFERETFARFINLQRLLFVYEPNLFVLCFYGNREGEVSLRWNSSEILTLFI